MTASTSRRTALRLGGAVVAAAAAIPALGSPAAARPHRFDPKPGADGVGDPLFPTLGNGGYQVLHYDLTFDFTPVTYDFSGTVRINARATQDLSAFNLDTDGHTIDTVTVSGRPARWELTPGRSGQELCVTPARPLHDGQAFTVEIGYRGNGKAPRLGLTGWNFGTDGGFASAAQSSRADTFLPCNDTPSDKATWTFHISAPRASSPPPTANSPTSPVARTAPRSGTSPCASGWRPNSSASPSSRAPTCTEPAIGACRCGTSCPRGRRRSTARSWPAPRTTSSGWRRSSAATRSPSTDSTSTTATPTPWRTRPCRCSPPTGSSPTPTDSPATRPPWSTSSSTSGSATP